jgi:hypothetical protein
MISRPTFVDQVFDLEAVEAYSAPNLPNVNNRFRSGFFAPRAVNSLSFGCGSQGVEKNVLNILERATLQPLLYQGFQFRLLDLNGHAFTLREISLARKRKRSDKLFRCLHLPNQRLIAFAPELK